MPKKKEHLKGLDAVAETLLIPLCYRAVEARQPNPFVCDPRAQEIIDQLDIDPGHLKWRPSQQIFAMLRARQCDHWARGFIANQPDPVIVEIGCGLDARFERLDNGRVRWVDMDLPEVIELRRVFIALAERFPGSELVVGALSPFMVRSSAFVSSFRGYQARPRWEVSDLRVIENWGSGIAVLDSFNYFDQPEPRLASVWWMTKIPILRNIARVLHLRLGSPL